MVCDYGIRWVVFVCFFRLNRLCSGSGNMILIALSLLKRTMEMSVMTPGCACVLASERQKHQGQLLVF